MTERGWRQFAALRHTPAVLLAQKIVRRIPFRPVDIGKLCFLRLDGVPHVAPGMLRGPAIAREATRADIDALAELQHSRDTFGARFGEGDRCVAAVVGDRIVGYEWFSANATHHETAWNYTIDIPDGCVYAYDAYIEPAYRNSGVWLRFKAKLAEWMLATDKHCVLTFIEYGNAASLRTHQRFGFKPSKTVLAIKVFGKSFFSEEDGRPVRRSMQSTVTASRVPLPEFSGVRK
jgi:GNAT superfamily N-acetyltransferase